MNKQRQELIHTIYIALKRGEITRGNRLLSERELVEKLNIKRSLLREALIALDTLGVIEIRERQGMFVSTGGAKALASGLEFLASTHSPVELITQAFEVRLMIETKAAALAAERRTEHACCLLKTERDLFVRLMKEDHPSKASLGFQHNTILHHTIMGAANNQVLLETFRGVSAVTQNAFSLLGSSNFNFHPYALWFDTLAQEHIDIVDAVIDGDAQKSYEAMERHLLNSVDRNNKILNETSFILYDNI